MCVLKKIGIYFVGVMTLLPYSDVTSRGQKVSDGPSSCEYTRAVLDSNLADAKKLSDNSYIIFVFRAGEKEARRINMKRMETVRKHIAYRLPDFTNFVLAEGESVSLLGKVEIYIQGKISSIIFLDKGKNIGENCVEEP